MLDKWSTQRARRVRICAVLAMHVPNLGIQAPRRFPCAFIHSPLFSRGQKRKVLAHYCLVTAST